ncbi:MAG: adenine methyltransferase [Proteobacteria bacterium]|nr:adenine methyltransferase [Pseudomonadota bacterium]
MDDVHYKSQSNEWATPRNLFDKLNTEFKFTLDPCATAANAKCAKFYTLDDDGLSKDWGDEVVFMNPPYGRAIKHWVRKAYESHTTVVCLIPSRTDTRYWHKYCMKADEIRFICGRLSFNDGAGSAPFPSAIVVFRRVRSDGMMFVSSYTV